MATTWKPQMLVYLNPSVLYLDGKLYRGVGIAKWRDLVSERSRSRAQALSQSPVSQILWSAN